MTHYICKKCGSLLANSEPHKDNLPCLHCDGEYIEITDREYNIATHNLPQKTTWPVFELKTTIYKTGSPTFTEERIKALQDLYNTNDR